VSRPAGLLLVLLATLVLAACGGDSGAGAGGDVDELLTDTFDRAKPMRSGKIALKLDVQGSGLPSFQGPLAIALDGPFQSRGAGRMPKFDFDLDFTTGSSTLRAGAISTGDKGWLTLQDRAYTLSDELFGQLDKGRADATKGADGSIDLKSLGVDPRRWLKDPRREGEEQAGGVPAIHISAGIDVPRLLTDVNSLLGKAAQLGVAGGGSQAPSGLDAKTRQKIAASVQRADVDIWTGAEDHQLRRIAVDVGFEVPEKLRDEGGAPQRGTVLFDLTISELNREQAIGPPANPRPLSELTSALAELAAALQQEQAGQQGAQQGGTDYDTCVASAGADLQKVQDCAALIGR